METVKYFTWGQVLYNEMFNLISCFSMAFNIINVALIKNCFLGGRLKFSKKVIYRAMTIVPLCFAYFLVGAVTHLISNGWDFSAPIENDTSLPVFNIVVKILIFAVVFFTSFELYDKHRFLHSLGYYLAIVLIEFYFQSLIMYSMVYFSDDKAGIIQSLSLLEIGDATAYKFVIKYFVIIFFIFLIMYYAFYRRNIVIYISWGYRIFFLLWALIIGIFPMFPIVQETTEDMYRMIGYGLGVMIPILILGVPLFIILVVSRRFAVEKTELQENYINSELEYINQYKKNQSETRAFRHDIVNNLSLLSMLMENGKNDEAKEHLNSLLGNIKALSPKYNTGDEMLDCIVTMKASIMEEKGINFSLEGVADGGLNMKPVDICSLFANALDNAIDACDKIPDDSEKKVEMVIKRTDTFFNIRIVNRYLHEKIKIDERMLEDGERFTSKENKNLHGYGIRNMKQIVLNYNGMIKVETNNDLFILSIMIPRIG